MPLPAVGEMAIATRVGMRKAGDGATGKTCRAGGKVACSNPRAGRRDEGELMVGRLRDSLRKLYRFETTMG